jgi:hypothetical protein
MAATRVVGSAEIDSSSRFSSDDVGDLAVLWACLKPEIVLVRGRGTEGTTAMRCEADGNWYFMD